MSSFFVGPSGLVCYNCWAERLVACLTLESAVGGHAGQLMANCSRKGVTGALRSKTVGKGEKLEGITENPSEISELFDII